MKGGQAQHLAFLPILVTLDRSKSLQRPGKLYYVTVYCAVIWVFQIPLSRWCFFAEPMLWLPVSHNLRLLGSYPWPQARLGIPIFGSDFWDPHWKRNSNSLFNSKDSGQIFFFKFRCWKFEKSEFHSEIRNSEKNKRRNPIHLILHAMSIVMGQPVGLTMSNHMDVGIIPGKGNLSA